MIHSPTGWCPPHCPNPNCKFHQEVSPEWRYKRKGFYHRQAPPRRVQRFTCQACHRQFSSQSFSTTYWLKRPELLPRIFDMVVGCMGNRQIGRALGCPHSTVGLHVSRLARHCLLYQAADLVRMPAGDIVIDGFETFEWSQYFPFHHNVAVDARTGLFLYHTDSPLRRKGRMTAFQRRRRSELEEQLGRPDPKAVERGVGELLRELPIRRGAVVRSDDHRAYPRAVAALGLKVEHQITSSKARRDARNPLWEVNRLDLMIRHSTAAHKRETIAFAKRRQSSCEKIAIFQVWYNYIKRRWIKGRGESAAMVSGLRTRMETTRGLLQRRRFRSHETLPERWARYYDRRVDTVALARNRRHTLTYAY